MSTLTVISFLIIIIVTLVTTYILVDSIKEKTYFYSKFICIYFLLAVTFEWLSVIFLIWWGITR